MKHFSPRVQPIGFRARDASEIAPDIKTAGISAGLAQGDRTDLLYQEEC
jgi:hypothetical protein